MRSAASRKREVVIGVLLCKGKRGRSPRLKAEIVRGDQRGQDAGGAVEGGGIEGDDVEAVVAEGFVDLGQAAILRARAEVS
jgi:hypothetical protein